MWHYIEKMSLSTMSRLMNVLDTIGVRDAYYGVAIGARIEILYKVGVGTDSSWYKGTIIRVYGNNVEICFDDGQVDVYSIDELEKMVDICEIRKIKS